MASNPVYFRKADNSEAFNNHFLKISLKNPIDESKLSRADFVTGCIVKSFVNPAFPLYVDFDESETSKLNYINEGYLVVYDKQGRRLTAKGSIRFTIKNGVICRC